MVTSQLVLGFLKCPNFSSRRQTPLWQVITSLAQWVGPRTREPFQEIMLKPVLDSPKRPKKLYRAKSLKCPSFLAILVFNIGAEVFFRSQALLLLDSILPGAAHSPTLRNSKIPQAAKSTFRGTWFRGN